MVKEDKCTIDAVGELTLFCFRVPLQDLKNFS